MPNEFEKQVQQLMDELKFVPSEPVWQKVEMQIRKKRDRRRLILWIPLLLLLSGGGLWIGIDHYPNNIAYHKSNDESQKQNQITTTPTKTTTNTAAKEMDYRPGVNKKELNGKSTINQPENVNDVAINTKSHPKVNLTATSITPGIHPSQNINQTKENEIIEEKMELKEEETPVIKPKFQEVVIDRPVEKINQIVSSFIIPATDGTSAFPLDKMPNKPTLLLSDSVKHDTTSIKKLESKKLAGSKWKSNLVAASGLSGLNHLNFLDVLNVFDGQKSMDAMYSNSPGSSTGGTVYAGPSPVKKGLSFSLGASAQKQLSKRLLFSIGLQYNYYSNSILVGDKIRRDTVFRYAYAVSQYFTNARTAYSYSIAAERYHNHYHFISLPVTIEWQMFRKLPLNFYTGFSVQQMIQTNALTFDYNSQAYYHSSKAFNKTLLFTEYGLNYTFPVNKKFLTIGPQLQYGLGRLEKNNSDHHLFFYGLKAQLQLNKN